jgi:3-dehydroquinate synthase
VSTERVEVELGARSYPVTIGAGLLARPDALADAVPGARLLVVTDDIVGPLYARRLAAALPGRRLETVTIAAGEQSKTLAECAAVFAALAGLGAGRDAAVIALGGGVVGDLAGFAAACWMRGIACVQVPTTLLAMVDSAVGGKTAVNLPEGKNLVGAFHQPAAVIADIDTLATLPTREFAAGMAEVVKYGAIGDAALFDWLDANADALLRHEPAALVHAIATSVRHKAGIVARDEHEAGERALLNFGHTFGHAIETATGYERYRHGEAVAIGMVQAARLSARLGLAPAADGARLARLLARFGLPVTLDPAIDPQRLLGHMRLDKKATGAGLRFVLWRGIGRAELVAGVAEAEILAALADLS